MRSSKPPPPDPDGLAKRSAVLRVPGRCRRGKQPGTGGAWLAQVADATRSSHTDRRCPACGARLPAAEVVGTARRQVFDLSEVRLRVIEYRLQRYRCSCGQLTAATFLDKASAPAGCAPKLRALIAYLIVYRHLPTDRLAQLRADLPGALVLTDTMAEIAAKLEPFLAPVRAQLAAAPVGHSDETETWVRGRLHWVHSGFADSLPLVYGCTPVARSPRGTPPSSCQPLMGAAVRDG